MQICLAESLFIKNIGKAFLLVTWYIKSIILTLKWVNVSSTSRCKWIPYDYIIQKLWIHWQTPQWLCQTIDYVRWRRNVWFSQEFILKSVKYSPCSTRQLHHNFTYIPKNAHVQQKFELILKSHYSTVTVNIVLLYLTLFHNAFSISVYFSKYIYTVLEYMNWFHL